MNPQWMRHWIGFIKNLCNFFTSMSWERTIPSRQKTVQSHFIKLVDCIDWRKSKDTIGDHSTCRENYVAMVTSDII